MLEITFAQPLLNMKLESSNATHVNTWLDTAQDVHTALSFPYHTQGMTSLHHPHYTNLRQDKVLSYYSDRGEGIEYMVQHANNPRKVHETNMYLSLILAAVEGEI